MGVKFNGTSENARDEHTCQCSLASTWLTDCQFILPRASSGYTRVESQTDCRPSGTWKGAMNASDCFAACPLGFIHATEGDYKDDNNCCSHAFTRCPQDIDGFTCEHCKCVNPGACTRYKDDPKFGRVLYAATTTPGQSQENPQVFRLIGTPSPHARFAIARGFSIYI